MKPQELRKAFEEGIIDKEQYKQQLFNIETTPKVKKVRRKLPTFLTQKNLLN